MLSQYSTNLGGGYHDRIHVLHRWRVQDSRGRGPDGALKEADIEEEQEYSLVETDIVTLLFKR